MNKKYNISHVKLLKMIKKGKLKENTRIYASDCPEAFIWKNDTLYFHGEPANFKMFIENIKYAKFKIVDLGEW
mgnify:FL=1